MPDYTIKSNYMPLLGAAWRAPALHVAHTRPLPPYQRTDRVLKVNKNFFSGITVCIAARFLYPLNQNDNKSYLGELRYPQQLGYCTPVFNLPWMPYARAAP